MGWFDDQIEYRKKRERELLGDSFENIARAVTGRKISSSFREEADVSDAVSALMRHLGLPEKEVPARIHGLEDRLDFLLSSSGVLYREVVLKKGWHADAIGPMIGSLRSDGAVVAILPSNFGGYQYTDPHTGEEIRVTAAREQMLGEEALCFYRPLPMRELKLRDVLMYMMSCLTTWDLAAFGLATVAVTGVGMLIPKLNQILMGAVIAYGSSQLLAAVMGFLLFAMCGSILFSIIRSLLLGRIRVKLSLGVNAAAMMRILNLRNDCGRGAVLSGNGAFFPGVSDPDFFLCPGAGLAEPDCDTVDAGGIHGLSPDTDPDQPGKDGTGGQGTRIRFLPD